jgi:hypothetical protein
MYPGAVAEIENDLLGEEPEHAGAAREQQRGLQQTDRKDGREVRQVLGGVLLDERSGFEIDEGGYEEATAEREPRLGRCFGSARSASIRLSAALTRCSFDAAAFTAVRVLAALAWLSSRSNRPDRPCRRCRRGPARAEDGGGSTCKRSRGRNELHLSAKLAR